MKVMEISRFEYAVRELIPFKKRVRDLTFEYEGGRLRIFSDNGENPVLTIKDINDFYSLITYLTKRIGAIYVMELINEE